MTAVFSDGKGGSPAIIRLIPDGNGEEQPNPGAEIVVKVLDEADDGVHLLAALSDGSDSSLTGDISVETETSDASAPATDQAVLVLYPDMSDPRQVEAIQQLFPSLNIASLITITNGEKSAETITVDSSATIREAQVPEQTGTSPSPDLKNAFSSPINDVRFAPRLWRTEAAPEVSSATETGQTAGTTESNYLVGTGGSDPVSLPDENVVTVAKPGDVIGLEVVAASEAPATRIPARQSGGNSASVTPPSGSETAPETEVSSAAMAGRENAPEAIPSSGAPVIRDTGIPPIQSAIPRNGTYSPVSSRTVTDFRVEAEGDASANRPASSGDEATPVQKPVITVSTATTPEPAESPAPEKVTDSGERPISGTVSKESQAAVPLTPGQGKPSGKPGDISKTESIKPTPVSGRVEGNVESTATPSESPLYTKVQHDQNVETPVFSEPGVIAETGSGVATDTSGRSITGAATMENQATVSPNAGQPKPAGKPGEVAEAETAPVTQVTGGTKKVTVSATAHSEERLIQNAPQSDTAVSSEPGVRSGKIVSSMENIVTQTQAQELGLSDANASLVEDSNNVIFSGDSIKKASSPREIILPLITARTPDGGHIEVQVRIQPVEQGKTELLVTPKVSTATTAPLGEITGVNNTQGSAEENSPVSQTSTPPATPSSAPVENATSVGATVITGRIIRESVPSPN